MDTILSSRDNPLIRQVRELLGSARARRENRLFAIEGARLCADAARSGAAVTAFLYTRRAAETYRSYWEPVAAAAQRRFEIPEALMKYAADTATPQGMLCVCAMLDNRPGLDTIEPHARYLALEDIQDPANLGTVIRTAEALGLSALLLSDGCCDPYNPKVLRGSMGGVFRLPLLPAGDLAHTAEILGRRGVRCFACVPQGGEDLRRAGLSAGAVCLIGNEGRGLRPETAAACTGRLTIPMGGRAESLNAAVAASILMWEMMRS